MSAAHRGQGPTTRAARRILAVLRDGQVRDGAGSVADDHGAGGAGYLCEVVAWGLGKSVDDEGREIYLDGYWADTPQTAVRWLAVQAAQLADRLDPQPGHGWARGYAAEALRQLPAELPDDWPDPGPVLRGWCTDEEQCRETACSLREGEPFVLATRDHTAFYSLSARPVCSPGRCTNSCAKSGPRRPEQTPPLAG